jgi:hypothetical protein
MVWANRSNFVVGNQQQNYLKLKEDLDFAVQTLAT